MSSIYHVNEIFYSLQGEGARVGTPNIFVRMSYCNLKCRIEPGPLSPGGFDCDTEFASAEPMSADQIMDFVRELGGSCRDVIFTGGEPLLQLNLNHEILQKLLESGYKCIVETNGTQEIMKYGTCQYLNYITCSPKQTAEHAIRLEVCDELRYVRGYGQPIPNPVLKIAKHKIISPAFDGTDLDSKTLTWCINLVKKNPEWRLSVQQHKLWKIR